MTLPVVKNAINSLNTGGTSDTSDTNNTRKSDESQNIHVIHSRMDEFVMSLKKNNIFSLVENWMFSLFPTHNLPITKNDLEEEEKFV